MGLFHKLTAKITRTQLRKFITTEIHTNLYTLDIGCANSPYASLCPKRVGFDITPGPGVDVVGDAHTLPFPDNTFEQILCTEVLEHLHTPANAIAEMHRVLKPGGTIVLTTRFLFPIHDAPHDYFRYTKYGLQHLFTGWELLKLQTEVQTMETFAVLFQRIGFQTKLRMNMMNKILFFLLAKVFMMLNWLILAEYGDIKKSYREDTIMTSGYYLVARKR